MSDQMKESLSAVIDGEADEFELRRVLDETSSDPALRGVWDRYHMVRSVIRGEGRAPVNSLGERFWSRIDAGEGADDAVEATQPLRRRSPWLQRAAGVAVAAGVAAAVIIGFKVEQNTALEAPKVAVVEPVAATSDDEDAAQAMPAADLQRAHAYMIHHARHVALNNRSVVPFVKVAAYESK